MSEIVTLKLSEIIPYDHNPRKNDSAVDDVAESIRQCGYKAKIIVDEDNVIIAGHTRWKALQKLGWTEVEVQRETDMTEEQKRKYRLLDNKVGERSTWDFELLDKELQGLDFEGFDFGFDVADIDDDYVEGFFERGVETKHKEQVIGLKLEFESEEEREACRELLEESGYEPTDI